MTESHTPAHNRAVVLLSGGIDSATTTALATAEGFEVYAISFDYGQRHRHELRAARAVGRSLQVKQHLFFEIDLTRIGGSALTANIRVPKGRSESDRSKQIPITYVPARNTIFLSVALAWAETLGANAIFIGANSVDYSGYPDCRPEFIDAFQTMANFATRSGVEGRQISVKAPLINFRKSQIIREGLRLGVDYSLTLSCYDPDVSGRACGECDSCLIRRRGFAEAGVPDPARYVPAPYPT